MTNILLQPVEVVRSDIGYWIHPDIANMAFATNREWELFKQQQNIEIATTCFGDDAPKHVQEAYEDGSPDFSEWNPTPPEGDGWFMLSIYDTEDMPVCMWARRLESENQPKAANCQYCDDGDGGCIFPHFGLAPHIHVGDPEIGSTQFLDQSKWPANFSPNESGTGVYTHCLSCGAPDNNAKIDIVQEASQGKPTMIKAFQAINARRQREEMPINPLAMFSEAWGFRQAEIDQLRQIIAELDIAKERLQLTVNAQSQNKEGCVLVPVESVQEASNVSNP